MCSLRYWLGEIYRCFGVARFSWPPLVANKNRDMGLVTAYLEIVSAVEGVRRLLNTEGFYI